MAILIYNIAMQDFVYAFPTCYVREDAGGEKFKIHMLKNYIEIPLGLRQKPIRAKEV